MLDGVVETLQWKAAPPPGVAGIEAAYGSMVAQRLGRFLNQLDASDQVTSARLFAALSSAEPSALERLIVTPEATCRLFWDHPGRCDDRDVVQFLLDSLAVEQTRAGTPVAGAPTWPIWSADGIVRWDADADVLDEQERVGGVRVDCASPAAACFDYSGLHGAGMRLAVYEDPSELAWAREKAERAMIGIDAVDAPVAAFVRRFTKVANLVVDTERPVFTSGSTGQYVGRSIFCNVHLPFVDAEIVADALVHESVHSLLYMDEIKHPWVLRDELFGSDVVTRSPWTGTPLPLRPFLQACFVWFSLWNFWTRARGSDGFAEKRIDECAQLARSGFLRAPLTDNVPDHVQDISPTILRLLEEMQDLVTAVSAVGPHS